MDMRKFNDGHKINNKKITITVEGGFDIGFVYTVIRNLEQVYHDFTINFSTDHKQNITYVKVKNGKIEEFTSTDENGIHHW